MVTFCLDTVCRYELLLVAPVLYAATYEEHLGCRAFGIYILRESYAICLWLGSRGGLWPILRLRCWLIRLCACRLAVLCSYVFSSVLRSVDHVRTDTFLAVASMTLWTYALAYARAWRYAAAFLLLVT